LTVTGAERESPVVRITADAIVAIVLVAELYLTAATASIGEAYQPGISTLRAPLNPLIFLVIFAGVPLILALTLPRHRFALIKFSARVSRTGVVVCVIAFALLLILPTIDVQCREAPPPIRELRTTLWHSLTCPSFSGRSAAVALYAGALSTLIFLCARRLGKVDLEVRDEP